MFRFTIRDVLWLMAVVGLAVGWCLDHRTQGAERREAVVMLLRLERFLGQEGYKMTWTDDNEGLTILRPGAH